MTKVTITNREDSRGDRLILEHKSDETLLELLERHNIDIQFHCRDGFCGACRCKLIAGDVDYVSDPLAFIDDNEFLPCCSKPSSPISIELE